MLEYVLCMAILTACICFAFQSFTRPTVEPPGPKGYPFFGVIFETDSKTLYKKLYEWTKQYGDYFPVSNARQEFSLYQFN